MRICLLLLLLVSAESQDTADGIPPAERLPFLSETQDKILTSIYLIIRKGLHNGLGSNAGSTARMRAQIKERRALEPVAKSVPFPCDVSAGRSAEVPTSVHRLRPGDIDVIGAFGDSLLAAFGAMATNPLELIRENRGISAAIGGQGTWREFMTLPNILKSYNPNLFGYSLGDSVSFNWTSQFNLADGVTLTPDMPYMATKLINRLKSDPRVDMKNHWKLISLLIGANDFCWDMCYNKDIDEYIKRRKRFMIKTMDILRDNLPRTIVNLVVPPDVGRLLTGFRGPWRCRMFQGTGCPCVLGSRFANIQKSYRPQIVQGLNIDFEVAAMSRYDRDDFAVVAQPFLINMSLPLLANGDYDVTYMSYDCFHLSPKGHSRAGISIWNNMLEPVGHKTKAWNLENDKIKCVTPESPYIYTGRNSQGKR